MPIEDDQARRLISMYEKAEREILRIEEQALLVGDENTAAVMKAKRATVANMCDQLRAGTAKWAGEAIPIVYNSGLREIDKSLDSVIDIGAIHQRAIAILSEAEIERWNAVTDSILREYDDVVREIQLEAVRSSIAGYESIQGAARAMRESLASRGITSITDKAGRKWSISEYADMAAHTATMRAKNEATINRLLEHDIKLCRLSGHTKSCSRCAPWEGKTLSITGEDREYPSLADARAAGVFHPRCKHTITAAL